MAQISKRYKALAAKVDRNKLYALDRSTESGERNRQGKI